MNIIESLILGIIQGLTEFLPVSSSGHLELAKHYLEIELQEPLLFSILVHAATALSTIVVFRKDILEIIKSLFTFNLKENEYTIKLALSMIPVGVVGVLFEEEIEALFSGQIILVSAMLLVTGALLLFTQFKKSGEKSVSYLHTLIIGVAQAIAILPGISRSGATISTALLLGIDKEKAARFSFLMVLAPILGATLLKAKDYFEQPAGTVNDSPLVLSIGFIAAFVTGLLACTLMINIVKRGKLLYFAIYCISIGLLSIVISIL